MRTHPRFLLGKIISTAVFLFLTVRGLHAGSAYIDTDPPWQLDSSGNKVVVIEKGDSVWFTLHASDDDNGFLGNYEWTLTNGNVTSNITGMTATATYGASADGSDNSVSVSLVHDDSLNPNITCTNGTVDSVTVRVVKLDVMEVSYSDDGDNSNVKMIDAGSTYASNTGPTISSPEWTSGGNNSPTCYVQNGSPQLTVKFSVSPAMTDANISADAYVSGDFDVIDNTGTDLGSITFDTEDIDLSGVGSNVTQVFNTYNSGDTIPEYVSSGNFNGTFTYGINQDPDITINTHPQNEIILTYETPDSSSTITRKRIEGVCTQIGITTEVDDSDIELAVAKIAMNSDNFSDTSSMGGGDVVWSMLDGTAKGSCAAQAYLMKYCVRLLGIEDGAVGGVYPRDGTPGTLNALVGWSGDWIDENSSGNPFAFSTYSEANPGDGTILLQYTDGGGGLHNYFEGCFSVGGTYYEGGENGDNQTKPAYVLMDDVSEFQHWSNSQTPHVVYPPAPYPDN
jgi:hypothetical protein